MNDAGITGARATPRALRHTFGVQAVQDKIALSLIKKWLGHAKVETTAIYTEPIGDEERALARLMWPDFLRASSRADRVNSISIAKTRMRQRKKVSSR
jgi:integrase